MCTLELTAVQEACRSEACAGADMTSGAPTLAAARVTQPWGADRRAERRLPAKDEIYLVTR